MSESKSKSSKMEKTRPTRLKDGDDSSLKKNNYKKYARGRSMNIKAGKMKDPVLRKKIREQDRKLQKAVDRSARSELLLSEEPGYLELDSEEESYRVSQRQIAEAVDITSATKSFSLDLHQFGPYHLDFSRNGRNLLLGGTKGHIAAFDWVTKTLQCEISVQESIHDVVWLHMPTMFAVAQKNWVFIYDNQGTELHCLKQMYRVQKMEFLPYHFLLAAASDRGFLSWLDISVGKMVHHLFAKSGCLDVLCQNPTNAILATGHSNGAVKMWSPNSDRPLVDMLCHPRPVRAMAIDARGTYLATASIDKSLKIWDLRNYGLLRSYKLSGNAGNLCFSQTGLLGTTMGNLVEVYRDIHLNDTTKPYLRHTLKSTSRDAQFCPYEDILGAGHALGYSSLLIPGSGEANFDAYENNPYMNRSQRREMEIKALLEKIQPEMITLNPRELGQVDVEKLSKEKKPRFGVNQETKIEKPVNMSGRDFYFLKQKKKRQEERKLKKEKTLKEKAVKKSKLGALGRFKTSQ